MITTYNLLLDRAVRFTIEHPVRVVALGVASAALIGILSSLVTR